MIVNILGTEYKIIVKKYQEDESFEKNSLAGYCDGYAKEIVICDMTTYKGWELEPEKTAKIVQKETLRHEIVHAFLWESGLNDNTRPTECGWARNEEMVDWIALQGTKIYQAWKESDAI